MSEDSKYFVCTDDAGPECICFSMEDAIAKDFKYIDTFDENGNAVEEYKLVNGKYTREF